MVIMFTRTHRIGRNVYAEALESYRDETGRPRHRCLARWRAERTFSEELDRTRFAIEKAADQLRYWQGLLDQTVQSKFWRHRLRAPEMAKFWRHRLNAATAHLAALMTARQAGLAVDNAEVEQAEQAEASRWVEMGAMFQLRPAPDLVQPLGKWRPAAPHRRHVRTIR
jgi:hypothetical protein